MNKCKGRVWKEIDYERLRREKDKRERVMRVQREIERERETSIKRCLERDMIKGDRLRDISRDQCQQRYVERYMSREKYVEVDKSSERSHAKAVERETLKLRVV
jgi:hypothetical protein